MTTGNFIVGLTDRIEYQRTQTVLILAAGYRSGESAMVNVAFAGTSATGFPHTVTASASGLVTDSWHILVDDDSGMWTVTITGTTTTKAPVDSQQFTVNPATLLVTVSTSQAIYARTQTITVFAIVRYPDGTVLNDTYPPVTNPVITVTFVNGSVTRTMSFNVANWTATYTVPGGIPPTNLPQTWNIRVTADDGEPSPTATNRGVGQTSVRVQLVPSNPDLEFTTIDSSGASLVGASVKVYFNNGTFAAQGLTDANGNAFFTLPTAFSYFAVASQPGYNDYLDSFFLRGNLMQRTLTLSKVLYTGTVLSGSYAAAAHYNPGDSGKLVVWIFNQNTTFSITITKIEVQFPWFTNYGNSYIGNASVPGLPTVIQPRHNFTATISFPIPNDGRAYASGGQILFTGTAPAWKTAWNITSTGPVSYRTITSASIDPKNGYYAGHGFVVFGVSIPVSPPTLDTSGTSSKIDIVELLLGVLIVNVIVSALIWLRLKPLGKMGAQPKV